MKYRVANEGLMFMEAMACSCETTAVNSAQLVIKM